MYKIYVLNCFTNQHLFYKYLTLLYLNFWAGHWYKQGCITSITTGPSEISAMHNLHLQPTTTTDVLIIHRELKNIRPTSNYKVSDFFLYAMCTISTIFIEIWLQNHQFRCPSSVAQPDISIVFFRLIIAMDAHNTTPHWLNLPFISYIKRILSGKCYSRSNIIDWLNKMLNTAYKAIRPFFLSMKEASILVGLLPISQSDSCIVKLKWKRMLQFRENKCGLKLQ